MREQSTMGWGALHKCRSYWHFIFHLLQFIRPMAMTSSQVFIIQSLQTQDSLFRQNSHNQIFYDVQLIILCVNTPTLKSAMFAMLTYQSNYFIAHIVEILFDDSLANNTNVDAIKIVCQCFRIRRWLVGKIFNKIEYTKKLIAIFFIKKDM